jgi:predicted O-methyltransferase YrrM
MKHIKTALRYIKFLFSARNTRGHGIHSPYIFDFVQTVLCGQNPYYIFSQIEKVRNTLLENDKTLNISDFGAGKSRKQSVKSIAKRSLKSPRFAQLLFRAVHYSKSVNVLELGTSLGITTAYLAASNSKIRCITLEGSAEIAAVARENWNRLKIKNIECVVGNIDETLQNIVNQHF